MARSAGSPRPNPRRSPQNKAARPFPYVTALVILVAALSVGGAAWWLLGHKSRAGAVVLISIDTLRADHLPLYGYTQGRTPAIDAFAKDAVLFERAYAHAPQTLPSHASILSGRLPFEHGVRDNLGFTLKPDIPTMASLFGAAGYRTGGFVSAYVLRQETGIGHGFEVYDAALPQAAADKSIAMVQRPGPDTLAAAEAWLRNQRDDHFFLFFHIYEPHKPYAPPERYASLGPYDGEVAMSDEIVGHLLDDLKARQWYEQATIVLLSDHGEGLGDHGEQEHGLFLYNESIHVPLLMKLPGNRDGGTRLKDVVQHIDVLPTLGGLTGVHVPADLRGRNLSPLFANGRVAPQGIYSEALYARYHFGWSELFALTDDRYRYIKAPREELYDLEQDPGEHTDIAAARGQAAGAMRAGLDALIANRALDAPSLVSAEDRQKLAALGYVGSQTAAPAGSGLTLPDPKDKAPVLKTYREAVDAMNDGRFADAAETLKRVVAMDAGMTDVWLQYAAVLVRMGRAPEALAAYQQAIRLKPDEPAPLLGAAGILLDLGRNDDAQRHAELAVASSPAAAHELLARIALARSDWDGARREAELTERADPTMPMTLIVRGLIQYNQGHYAEALPSLVEAHDRFASRTLQMRDLRYVIGDALARLERYPEAEKYFIEEFTLFPTNVRARSGLAMIYAAVGRPADVERVIGDMLRASPTPKTYEAAAQLWRNFGHPERAAAVSAAGLARFGRGPGR